VSVDEDTALTNSPLTSTTATNLPTNNENFLQRTGTLAIFQNGIFLFMSMRVPFLNPATILSIYRENMIMLIMYNGSVAG
jgi:hypothetical protein